MKRSRGFSILEVLITVAVVAILASIAVPKLVSQRHNARLKDAVSMIRQDLEMARSWAIRENAFVPVIISSDGYTYSVFIDNGSGMGAENWLQDADETTLCNRTLPEGIRIDLTQTTLIDHRTRFNGKGYSTNNGIITLLNVNGKSANVDMSNRFGRIRTY